jgi:hypothetical protein
MDNSLNIKLHSLQETSSKDAGTWIDNNVNNTSSDVEFNLGIPNSYWRPILKPERIKIEHDKIVKDFLNHFPGLWYLTKEPVWINSWIDETVYFIWAPISVLKPYILNQNIPQEWICMSQDCIRTRNTKTLFDDTNIPKWWSRFTWIAVLVQFSKWEKLLNDSIEFLLKTLNIPLDNIRIQINSKDKDLRELLDSVNCPIEQIENEKDDVYYTHRYWMWKIVGRNFNFVLREKWTDNFNDIWNFIIIEDDEWEYWIELALWTSVIMKELYELDHIIETSSITSIFWKVDNLSIKFQDSLVSSVLLFREWVKPNASNGKWKVFRSYLRWIYYFMLKYGISEEYLLLWIKEYEKIEYWDDSWSWEYIIWYLKDFWDSLKWKIKNISKEEQKILELL